MWALGRSDGKKMKRSMQQRLVMVERGLFVGLALDERQTDMGYRSFIKVMPKKMAKRRAAAFCHG